jgi:hypothetical protein
MRPRGRFLSIAGMTRSADMRNLRPVQDADALQLLDLLKRFDKAFGATGRDYGKVSRRPQRLADIDKRAVRPLQLPVHRRDVVPGPLQLRLPPHGALHHPVRDAGGRDQLLRLQHGIGWRNIIEKMHMTATLTKWYEEHGRHEIFAGGKSVPLSSTEHHLVLDPEAVAKGFSTTSTTRAFAKNAREEKIRARDNQLHNQQMADLYARSC